MNKPIKLNKRSRARIREWLIRTYEDGSWKNIDDLHVDEVSRTFKDPTTWIGSGLACLAEAMKVREEHRLPVALELGIPLASDIVPIGINFSSIEELTSQLSWTPPSLYLFEQSWEPWIESLGKGSQLLIEIPMQNIVCKYSEVKSRYYDPEYYQAVRLISIPRAGDK